MKPDPKLMLGGGFGLPEVQEIMTRELRAMKTSEVAPSLPRPTQLNGYQLRMESGLVEFYRLMAKSRHA